MKKLFSSFLAAAVAATAFAGLSITASAEDTACGVLIHISGAENDTELTAASSTIADAGISFDSDTKTITFTQSTTLSGVTSQADYYGSAFVCTNGQGTTKQTGLTINIPSGITVTCDNSTVSGLEYAYGIYLSNIGSVTVTGGGTLELICRKDMDKGECYGITDYGEPSFTLTADGATVKASGIYGFYNNGSTYNGYLSVTNGGVVELLGTESAIKAGIDAISGATLYAGESADTATKVSKLDVESKFVRITATAADVQTPTDVYVAGTPIYEETPTWTNGDVTATYDTATNTLTLSGTGTINGPSSNDKYYGAAIYAEKALNIEVAKDADITLNAGPGDGKWCFGIYIYTSDARLTIGGSGKLTVTNSNTSDWSCAISPYGTLYPSDYALTLKDSVKVIANGGCKYGIIVGTGGVDFGEVCIKDSATLTAQGTSQALYNARIEKLAIYGGKSFAGSMDNGKWNFDKPSTEVFTEVKALSIAPATSASYTEDTTDAFVGSDNATGFITTVTAKGNLVIQSIKWNVTSGTETKPLTPQGEKPIITLADGANAVFKVIVSGLKDPNATAVAVVE